MHTTSVILLLITETQGVFETSKCCYRHKKGASNTMIIILMKLTHRLRKSHWKHYKRETRVKEVDATSRLASFKTDAIKRNNMILI